VADERGRERERYPVAYGAKIKVRADQKVKARTVLVEWDPFTNPILTEFTGRVEYQDIVEGITVREEFDEVTGMARKVVIEDPEGKLQPGVIIRTVTEGDTRVEASERHRYALPVGARAAARSGGRGDGSGCPPTPRGGREGDGPRAGREARGPGLAHRRSGGRGGARGGCGSRPVPERRDAGADGSDRCFVEPSAGYGLAVLSRWNE